MLRTAREMPEVLPFIQAGLHDIFPLTSPFISVRAMDMLWDGIYIDCDKTEFTAKAICAAIAAEPVERIDEKHFKASIFKRVRIVFRPFIFSP